MTRKYIEALAEAIRDVGPDELTAYNIAKSVAAAIAALKPGFDKARFLRDCGVHP